MPDQDPAAGGIADMLDQCVHLLTIWGYFVSFCTCVFVSLMLRYWSTECKVPVMARSFFSSTVTWQQAAIDDG